MSPRLRQTLTSNAVGVLLMVPIVLFLVPSDDRLLFFTVWLPAFVLISGLMDYFVWKNPARLARRESERQRPRYGKRPTEPAGP